MILAPIDENGVIQNSTNTSNSLSSDKTSSGSELDKDAFLQLLVAEMQYQDPLEPSSNTDYIAQLATFSQVEEMQNMSATLSKGQAADLVGRVVIMKVESASGETGYISGKVDYVVTEDSQVYLYINENKYNLSNLDTVVDDAYWQQLQDAEDGNEEITDKTEDTVDEA